MAGRRNSGFDNRLYLVEFKYFTNTEANKKKVLAMTEAWQKELNQINGYEKDILTQFPPVRDRKGGDLCSGE